MEHPTHKLTAGRPKWFGETQCSRIQQIFDSYCKHNNLHMASQAREALMNNLLSALQKHFKEKGTSPANLDFSSPLLINAARVHCREIFASNNASDLKLLYENPADLVLKYQPMIAHIVYKKTPEKGLGHSQMQEDLVADIREKMLQKAVDGKLAQYKGNASFSTYMYRIIYRSMVDELRRLQRRKAEMTGEEANNKMAQYAVKPSNVDYMGITEQHLERLQVLLKMLPSYRRTRFEFTLSVFYGIRLNAVDVRKWYPECNDEILVEILSHFHKDYSDMPKAELHEIVGEFASVLEENGDMVSTASFRSWFGVMLKNIKKALFFRLPEADEEDLDAYFELLVHKMYEKI